MRRPGISSLYEESPGALAASRSLRHCNRLVRTTEFRVSAKSDSCDSDTFRRSALVAPWRVRCRATHFAQAGRILSSTRWCVNPEAAVLYREFPAPGCASMIERVCDHFAGCLLMPRAWVESAYARGLHDPLGLAQVFGVSPSAMTVRLRQLGLSHPTPRCATTPSPWPGSPRWQPSRSPQHRVGVRS